MAYLDKEPRRDRRDTIDFTAAPTTNPTKACATPTPSTSTTTATARRVLHRPHCRRTPRPLRPQYQHRHSRRQRHRQADRAAERRAVIDNNRHGPAPKPSAAHGSPTSPPARAPRRELPPSSPTHSRRPRPTVRRLPRPPDPHEILGTTNATDITALIGKASEARAQLLALVQVLAAHEAATGKNDWRTINTDTVTYLRYLESLGYTLSEIELRACGEEVLTD
ncbi:hypothetical protein GS940_24130 [Rhodococcus hoagii]|nr:hypothetical protein [Prescottella equi]